MPARSQYVMHTFNGGWATDFGQTFYGPPNDAGLIQIPFLVDARNVSYALDGGPNKVGGTAKLNSVSLGATVGVTSLYDYFRSGTGGSTTERRVCTTSDGTVQTEALDGTWTSRRSGLASNAVFTFAEFNDLLLIANDSGTDVPMSWDQTTFQNLAGSPPTGSLVCAHRNYAWMAGAPTVPSRLYYSVSGNPENWTGAGSGSIDIDPEDGDRIVGLISHKNELWVFKGPYRGSIHRIQGSAPTGADAFARLPFIYGLGAVHQNLIFRFGDDIGFVSPWGTVHSLNATNAFGNYNQAFLSLPIDTYVRTLLNHGRLKQGWAVNDPTHGYVLMTLPGAAQANNTIVLMMDYRFNPQQPRWALWDAFSWASIALIRDSNKPRIFAGGYTGYVWKTDQTTASNDGTAINEVVTTPYFTYGSELRTKTLAAVSLGIVPANNNSVTFNWRRDGSAQQTNTAMTQGGGGGAVFGTDVFGTGTFGGGGRFIPRFVELEEGGEFRAVQYQFVDSQNNSSLEVHNIGARVIPAGESLEN